MADGTFSATCLKFVACGPIISYSPHRTITFNSSGGTMRFLQRVSIRNFMLAVIGTLVLVLAGLSASIALDSWRYYKETGRGGIANELADNLLAAAGSAAKERGFTATALSSDKPAEGALLQKIQDVRLKLD